MVAAVLTRRAAVGAADGVPSRKTVLSCAPMSGSTAERVLSRALGGDAESMEQLIEVLFPAVQAEVGAVLREHVSERRDARQEIDDLVQEVFAFLFADGARALRAWRIDGGRSLVSFVRLLARHQTLSIMRIAKRNPWTDEPMSPELVADVAGSIEGHERVIASRELLGALLDRLLPELTPRGMLLFQILYVEHQSVETACQELGISKDAVYGWRKRVKKIIAQLVEELEDLPRAGGQR